MSRGENFSSGREFSQPVRSFQSPQMHIETVRPGAGFENRTAAPPAQRSFTPPSGMGENRVFNNVRPDNGFTAPQRSFNSERPARANIGSVTGTPESRTIGTQERQTTLSQSQTRRIASMIGPQTSTSERTFSLGRDSGTTASTWTNGERTVTGARTILPGSTIARRDNIDLRVVNNVSSGVRTTGGTLGTVSNRFGGRTVIDRDGHRTLFIDRDDFVFFDHHHFLNHRIIRPDFFFVADFGFEHRHFFCPVFPFFHRSFIFVNPCGFWPWDYDYQRYYWYGCYPYYWYGYNPVPYEYQGDTYNYYSYNYNTDGSAYSPPAADQSAYNQAQQLAKPPAAATSADEYFDAGVKAFGQDDYKTAIAKFSLASRQATNDKVLPFAYSQAFFADGEYKEAAQVIRAAVAKVNPETEGVFYPRGLYSSDDVLLKQIDNLSKVAGDNPKDADLQLLLGYQYLGMGEYDKAAEPLKNASTDSLNGDSAKALIKLLDKIQSAPADKSGQTKPASGQASPGSESASPAQPPQTPPEETPNQAK